MSRAYAVMERDWSGYTEYDLREQADGPVTVTQNGRTFRAVREPREVPPAFTAAEREAMQHTGTVVPHSTYSLQQDTFERAGFTLGPPAPGARSYATVQGATEVVCIVTEDRYDIFPAGTAVRRYASVDDWRASADYPAGVAR